MADSQQATKMREKSTKIPSRAQKRAAARYFREYDPDAVDSPTDSESETERLQRYPAKKKPSPQKTASRMRQQLRKATSARTAGRKALKAEMDDESRRMAMRTRRALAAAERASEMVEMPAMLEDVPGLDDDDSKPGSGQVFLDEGVKKRKWDAVMRARRAVMTQVEKGAVDDSPSSDMGLFASLPGELRNRIYRFALVEGDSQPFVIAMEYNTCNQGACKHMRLPTAAPGILSTCAQIRAEAMPIFIAENGFKFDAEIVKSRCVANWLRAIGPYGALLNKVILDLMCWVVPTGQREKEHLRYEMSLRWKTKPTGRWSLMIDEQIIMKAGKEATVLAEWIDVLNSQMEKAGKGKEEALREFVWSDWLANCVFIAKK